MYLQDLQLKNFRNYEAVDLNFSKGVNVLLGENAQGKTNLLEAIYVLGLTRSYRTNHDSEFIRFDSDFSKINGSLGVRDTTNELQLVLSKDGKRVTRNSNEVKKLSDYIGTLKVVSFTPEDLSLVKGSPAIRRKFMDVEFGQLSPVYLGNLSTYNKVLKQRNRYLKQISLNNKLDQNYLDVLSEQLAEVGAKLIQLRRSYLEKLLISASQVQLDLSNDIEKLEISYKTVIDDSITEIINIKNKLIDLYKVNQEQEIRQGSTLIGPHRDDIVFKINGMDVREYGSQGQQRTTSLSVKLGEINLFKEINDEFPILLLDDVLSELDSKRQTKLLAITKGKVQTFITTPSLSDVSLKIIKSPKIFNVSRGTIAEGE